MALYLHDTVQRVDRHDIKVDRVGQETSMAERGNSIRPSSDVLFPSGFIAIVLAAGASFLAGRAIAAPPPTTQWSIERVELMPNRPTPFKHKDFKAIARGLDQLLFDFNARGQYLPLIWWDDSKVNVPVRGFGFPSYVGRPEQSGGSTHESITTMGALLGATIAGIDKSRGEHNWVEMAQVYFNSKNGENVVLNRVEAPTGHTYWYETFPQILFNCLVDRYPDTPRATEIMRTAAERWYAAYKALAARPGGLDFEHTAFSLSSMQPVDNGRWHEPDGAEGLAWILFSAYRKFGDEKYLAAAKDLIACTDRRQTNPHYEINHLWGTYLSARLNAEHDTNYDVGQFINWCFNPSESRPGWGVAVGRWGDFECSGIAAGVNIAGGYGFVMNTYVLGGTLVPLVRYDERYARAVGKWMLCAMNAVRLCYPDELPADMQSSPGWHSNPPNVIAYEGLIHVGPGGKRPYAQGDAIKGGWGPSDLGIYGSGFVGMFAGIINATNDPMIPQLDLLACDFFRDQAYPSYLYYNPYDEKRQVNIDVGNAPVDVYDAVANGFVARNASGTVSIPIEADSARVLVLAPAGGKESFDGRKTRVNGVVIDFNNGRAAPRQPDPRPFVPDRAKAISATRASMSIDGDASDWAQVTGDTLHLNTGSRGRLNADLRFAWDERFLYVLVKQTATGKKLHEAKDAATFAVAPWNFDAVTLHIDITNGRVPSVGDAVVSLAFSSVAASNLYAALALSSTGTGQIQSATSGTADSGNRIIEARIPWNAMIEYSSNHQPQLAAKIGPIGPQFRFGCEPLLVESSHKQQSFIGGAQYAKPSGRDVNSCDIVLREEPG